jgi:hypothetical protein
MADQGKRRVISKRALFETVVYQVAGTNCRPTSLPITPLRALAIWLYNLRSSQARATALEGSKHTKARLAAMKVSPVRNVHAGCHQHHKP